MSGFDVFIWGVFPYLCLLTLIVVTAIRRVMFARTWSAKSSEFLEKKQERIGNPLFHIGIAFVFFGHLGGLSVPKALTDSIGVSEHLYHTFAFLMGGTFGVILCIGLLVLVRRRFGGDKRMKATTSTMDKVMYVALVATIVLGMCATFSNADGAFVYRDNVGPWFRGIMTLQPDPSLMAVTPPLFKVHIFCGLVTFALIPFTRLVHLFSGISAPFRYLKRKAVLYRQRNGSAEFDT